MAPPLGTRQSGFGRLVGPGTRRSRQWIQVAKSPRRRQRLQWWGRATADAGPRQTKVAKLRRQRRWLQWWGRAAVAAVDDDSPKYLKYCRVHTRMTSAQLGNLQGGAEINLR